MGKYRLKAEAIPYFSEKIAKNVEPLRFWETRHVDFNALEEIKEFYIESGHYSLTNKNTKHIQGWSSGDFGNDGIPNAEFHFTAHINGIEEIDYKSIDDRHLRNLMDGFEEVLENWYQNLHTVES